MSQQRRFTLRLPGNHLEDAINTLDQEPNGNKPSWPGSIHKTDPDAPVWVHEIDKISRNGKNYIIRRNGSLEEA